MKSEFSQRYIAMYGHLKLHKDDIDCSLERIMSLFLLEGVSFNIWIEGDYLYIADKISFNNYGSLYPIANCRTIIDVL